MENKKDLKFCLENDLVPAVTEEGLEGVIAIGEHAPNGFTNISNALGVCEMYVAIPPIWNQRNCAIFLITIEHEIIHMLLWEMEGYETSKLFDTTWFGKTVPDLVLKQRDGKYGYDRE